MRQQYEPPEMDQICLIVNIDDVTSCRVLGVHHRSWSWLLRMSCTTICQDCHQDLLFSIYNARIMEALLLLLLLLEALSTDQGIGHMCLMALLHQKLTSPRNFTSTLTSGTQLQFWFPGPTKSLLLGYFLMPRSLQFAVQYGLGISCNIIDIYTKL